MEASNLELTERILNNEMAEWQSKFGHGRNNIDLRFGQYIWCKYEMKELFPEPNGGKDGFAAEQPTIAYIQILEAIHNTINNG